MSGKQPPRKATAPPKAGQKVHKKAKILDGLAAKLPRKGTPKARSEVNPSATVKGKGKAKNSVLPSVESDKKGKSKAAPIPSLPPSFKIIAGSYEKLLYGLQGTVSDEDSNLKFELKPIFIFPAHVSCIKAVAASPNGGKWLATGSADEIVKVWDLRRRKEIGGLMHHEGSITHLEFPSRSHLLSASEDGTLSIFHARDWAVLRSLKGHKGRVNSVAVHPSGKVALSVGKDRTLRMWDLMRGKGCASTKIGKEGELVRWSVDGTLFVVQSQSTIDVYSIDMAILHTITHPSRVHDVKFCKRVDGEGEVLLVGAEDKKLSIYDISSDENKPPKVVAEMVGHANRVKAVDTIQIALPPTPGRIRKVTTLVSTISSDGKIHVYDLASLPVATSEKHQLEPVAEYDTKGSRLTCIALADGDADNIPTNGKRKREDDDVTSEEEEIPVYPEEEEEEEEEKMEEEDDLESS